MPNLNSVRFVTALVSVRLHAGSPEEDECVEEEFDEEVEEEEEEEQEVEEEEKTVVRGRVRKRKRVKRVVRRGGRRIGWRRRGRRDMGWRKLRGWKGSMWVDRLRDCVCTYTNNKTAFPYSWQGLGCHCVGAFPAIDYVCASHAVCVLHVYIPRGLNYVCASNTDTQKASTKTVVQCYILNSPSMSSIDQSFTHSAHTL